MKDKIFKFDSNAIKYFLKKDLRLFREMKEAFNYTYEKLEQKGFNKDFTKSKKINLDKVKWFETKNYEWTTIKRDQTQLLIRRYQLHFTIYIKVKKDTFFDNSEYCCITIYTDTDGMDDNTHDSYYDEPFTDLNPTLKGIFDLAAKGKIWLVWNDLALERPKHCEIKNVFENEEVSSFDKLIFCAEELHYISSQIFAENEMFEAVQKLKDKEGVKLNSSYTIKKIRTELENDYYHGVGITLVDERSGSESFQDVYSLTHWYLEEIAHLINQK